MRTLKVLVALGLTLPAIAFGQEDRTSVRDQDGPPRRMSQGPPEERGYERGPRPFAGGESGMRMRQERRQRMERMEQFERGGGGPGPRGPMGYGGMRGGPMRGGSGSGQPQFPPPPLMGALDVNHDGVIDEKEMDHASGALHRLDRDGDGKLTLMELRPRPFQDGRGPQGPGGMQDRRGGREPGSMRGGERMQQRGSREGNYGPRFGPGYGRPGMGRGGPGGESGSREQGMRDRSDADGGDRGRGERSGENESRDRRGSERREAAPRGHDNPDSKDAGKPRATEPREQ